MRTKIYISGKNEVSIENENGKTAYYIPFGGGYVRCGYNSPKQVCEYLDSLGNTLRAIDVADLLATIRREYKRSYQRDLRRGY